VHDAREIRAIGQNYSSDIFGANGVGVADVWNRVRIGGALGVPVRPDYRHFNAALHASAGAAMRCRRRSACTSGSGSGLAASSAFV
jgi:hypothetical protein